MSYTALTNAVILAELFALDPTLERVFREVDRDLLPSPKDPPKSPYALLIGAIIGQRIRYTTAKAIRSRLFKTMGEKSDYGPQDSQRVLSDQAWKSLGVRGPVLDTIKRVEGWCLARGNIWSVKELKAARLEGVGRWTLDNLQVSLLEDLDCFPVNDVFLNKNLQILYKLSRAPSKNQVIHLSKRWAPYRSIVCWWLWRWWPTKDID
jgi:DNA-3-methyladenine glycosylase II